jgi:hypothetical protein
MDKVYVVEYRDFDDVWVEGVFSTEEKAKAYIASRCGDGDEYLGENLIVVEYAIDTPIDRSGW